MIRPASFGYNAETAMNNSFQREDKKNTSADISNKSIEEFDNMVNLLRSKNIDVFVVQDSKRPPKPDAVFPNNWFCTLPNGELILFPMFAENRRIEKQKSILEKIQDEFTVKNFEDWSDSEKQNIFLEGTGSIIFDHENKIAYACISERTNKSLLEKFAKQYGYKPVSFISQDQNGIPIYHTNVMMHIAETYAIVCLDSIENKTEKMLVSETLQETEHEVIAISQEQLKNFAGNMIQVKNRNEEKFTILSSSAFDILNEEQKKILSYHTNLLPVNIKTIETIGGGSARCMIAEIFLGRKH